MKIKTFKSSAGLEILVGQDDESNDYLTFDVGHAHDMWFHVRGVPGSHVLLRCGEGKDVPDKQSLQEAAALAAWFSKMRLGGKVTVSYCPVMQVHKPRGAKPGSVVIKQEKKLVVRPALLEEQA
jgi:predicted ribosome quality control (RQC) complex YloA/Tae2 family protein